MHFEEKVFFHKSLFVIEYIYFHAFNMLFFCPNIVKIITSMTSKHPRVLWSKKKYGRTTGQISYRSDQMLSGHRKILEHFSFRCSKEHWTDQIGYIRVDIYRLAKFQY